MKFEQQPLIPIDFPNDSFSTIGKVSKKLLQRSTWLHSSLRRLWLEL